eukprot:gnl/Spiro4/7455_TR3904_c0_g1_i1.p1 gnl/Spiro4/7455_TR3904_c0_g1~~gnl/Spiro4/7455_TR3904_c0_g1_i1.p1  ORF type:complete len:293 (+),score=68.21 gnl/Spiro4/7455_TR3904_c0_g1_i1:39-881(+)
MDRNLFIGNVSTPMRWFPPETLYSQIWSHTLPLGLLYLIGASLLVPLVVYMKKNGFLNFWLAAHSVFLAYLVAFSEKDPDAFISRGVALAISLVWAAWAALHFQIHNWWPIELTDRRAARIDELWHCTNLVFNFLVLRFLTPFVTAAMWFAVSVAMYYAFVLVVFSLQGVKNPSTAVDTLKQIAANCAFKMGVIQNGLFLYLLDPPMWQLVAILTVAYLPPALSVAFSPRAMKTWTLATANFPGLGGIGEAGVVAIYLFRLASSPASILSAPPPQLSFLM